MPWQLIYTSAPRGLLSGQSGFCTVARSPDLREALAQRLEQFSSYHYLRLAEAATANRNPAISAFRLVDLRGAKYFVLTRIQPCGLDFTARTNHLAHHLVFLPDELLKLPSPAAILRLWPGWLGSWQGEPRWLKDPAPADFVSAAKHFLPAHAWARLTGDGGRAAGLLESECVRGCYLVCPADGEEPLLEMFCETLQLLNFNGQFPLRPWRHSFTTFLQAEDNPNDFQWRGCQENTPAYQQALTRSAPLIPLRSVRVPANSLVKLAREEPKPPTASPPPVQPPPPALSLQRKESAPAAPPRIDGRPSPPTARAGKPALLDINFSIHSTTLLRLGIFAVVIVVLLLIKHHPANRRKEQGGPAPAPIAQPPPVAAPRKAAPPAVVEAFPAARQMECLLGDGPTYVLVVPQLTHFRLPIHSIMRLQNLLHRYDKLETLPGDIQLTADRDRWDFPPGAPLTVGGRKEAPEFSAAGSGVECVLDYSDWLAGGQAPLRVQARFDREPGAFSIHFGFSSTNGGDAFRLLIVNETNPPAPLHLAGPLVRNDRQDVGSSLIGPMRDCLFTNFELLAGRQWQLEPFIKPKSRPARYLYKDWPSNDVPPFGCELDFAHVGQRLRAQRQDIKGRLDGFRETLARPLGQLLSVTNANLINFAAFSPYDLTPPRFLDYLDQLKKSAPEKWFKQWDNRFDSDQPDEVSGPLEELYNLWSGQRPRDQPMLTATNALGPTNYFFAAWQLLKEAELAQDQLAKVQKRLVELEQVEYIGLCIVDPRQTGTGLEMIRFGGP